MKKSRYTDSQIMAILKQGENGASVPDLYREYEMSTGIFYSWRAKLLRNGCFNDLSNERA